MDLKITNAELIGLNNGCHELLAVDDLETLFTLLVSNIVESLAPKLRAYEKTKAKLDKRYFTVETKDPTGAVIGKRAKNEEADDYTEKLQVLLDAGVNLKVAGLRMSAIYEMREKEGLPILSATIHKIRHVVIMDVDVDAEAEPQSANGADPAGEEEPETRKRQGRSERLKQAMSDAAQ